MFKIIVFWTLNIFFHLLDAYDYNDANFSTKWSNAPRYPEDCCQLEWIDIKLGDALPKDAFIAGQIGGKNYSFTYSKIPAAALKSDIPNEYPNWLWDNFKWAGTPDRYPILSNPNRCNIEWYRARTGEEVPTHLSDKYFPTLGLSMFGDFVRYQENIPGYMAYNKKGYFRKITSVTQSVWVQDASPIDMLYVDCKRSVTNMSIAELYDVKYEREKLNILLENPKTKKYEKIIKINNSNQKKSFKVDIDIEYQDDIILQLNANHMNIFKTYEWTYIDWKSNKYGDNPSEEESFDFLEFLGFFGENFKEMKQTWLASTAKDQKSNEYLLKNIFDEKYLPKVTIDANTDAAGKIIFTASSDVKRTKFTQSIDVPAHAKVSVVPFTTSTKGTVPFTATYQLKATRSMAPKRSEDASEKEYQRLKKTLQKHVSVPKDDSVSFAFDDKKQIVSVTLTGKIIIDADHIVDVHVESPVSLPGVDYPDDWDYE